MAAPDKTSTKTTEAAAKKPRRRLLLIGAAVLVVAIAAGAAWFFTKGNDEAAEVGAGAGAKGLPAAAQYFALDPAFVVNLADAAGTSRYLQLDVQLMSRDPLAIKDFELHAPAIRARLLMLFSQQSADGLVSRAGKEKLQAAALAETRKLLSAETGKPGADALLFTSFVMQ